MAGLIPDNFIQDLLSRSDLVEIIRRRITLKKSGRNYTACCPFHQEKTPSFSVSPSKQFYYCFGCGAKGDAIRFIMEYDHLQFPQAVEQLANQVGMEVPHEKETPEKRRQKSVNQLIYQLLERAEHFFQNQLKSAPERQHAQAYIKQRGLSADICQQFAIGYAPPGFNNIGHGLNLDAEQQQHAFTAGLFAENDSGRRYDKFRDRLMFPIRDSRGRTIGFGGRIMGDGKPKYLNSPETPVFHKGSELYGLWEWQQAREKTDHMLVVEGYMDVISLAQFGVRNVVATLGTATSETHLQKLFREVDKVVFCFDGDRAGRKAAWRAMENALPTLEDGKEITFLFLPDGEDPDTMVRTQGPESIRAANAQAQPLENFLFDQLSQDINLSQVAGRARLAKLALPYISQLKGPFYRELLEQSLAERAGLTRDELSHLAIKHQPSPKRRTATNNSTNEEPQPSSNNTSLPPTSNLPGNRLFLTERLLLLLVNHPALAQEAPVNDLLKDIENLPGASLLASALTTLENNPVTTSAQALGLLMALSEGDRLKQLLTTRIQASAWELAKREWQGGLLQLQLIQLDKRINQEKQAVQPDITLLQTLLVQRHTIKTEQQQQGYQSE